ATAQTYAATNLTATTYFRVIVTSGVCSAQTSASVVVNVDAASVAGTISGGGATVCAGINNTVLTLVGNTGSIQWQWSSDDVSFSNIAGQNGQTYTASNLTSTTYYRAVVTNGVCGAQNSPSVVLTVNPASVAGTISGGGIVCTGTNNTVLTLNGNTGTIQWQSSSDDVTFNDIAGATATTYTATNLTATTYYRAVVTNGVCASANTASVAINVSPAAVAGNIAGGGTFCGGGSTL